MDDITRAIQKKLGEKKTPAGFLVRFGARFVDGIIVKILAFVLLVAVRMLLTMSGEEGMPTDSFGFVEWGLMFFYVTFFISGGWQATPGKRMFGAYVETEDGKRLPFLHSAMRELVWYFPSIALAFYGYSFAVEHHLDFNNQAQLQNFLKYNKDAMGELLHVAVVASVLQIGMAIPILFRKDKKGFHDMICGTFVCRGKKVAVKEE